MFKPAFDISLTSCLNHQIFFLIDLSWQPEKLSLKSTNFACHGVNFSNALTFLCLKSNNLSMKSSNHGLFKFKQIENTYQTQHGYLYFHFRKIRKTTKIQITFSSVCVWRSMIWCLNASISTFSISALDSNISTWFLATSETSFNLSDSIRSSFSIFSRA